MSSAADKSSDDTRDTICVALYSFDIGGSEVLAVTLIRHWLDCGFNVVCIATRKAEGPLQQRLESWGVPCFAAGLEQISRFKRRAMRRRISAWMRDCKVVALHAHHFSVFSDVYDAAVSSGVQLTIVTEHTAEPIMNNWRFRRIVNRLAPKATICTAINNSVRTAISDASDVSPDDVVVIENGVDEDRFSPRSTSAAERGVVTIGWVGRLHPDKDVLNGLHAFALALSRVGYDMRLLVSGDGEQMEQARDFVRQKNIADRVEFLGTVTDVVPILHECDFFLMSSRTEGTPLALLEAMSCGLPVVATEVGGIPASVSTDAAILVPPRDSNALASAIVALAGDAALRRKMGTSARDLVLQRFSNKDMKNRYLKLLDGIGAGH